MSYFGDLFGQYGLGDAAQDQGFQDWLISTGNAPQIQQAMSGEIPEGVDPTDWLAQWYRMYQAQAPSSTPPPTDGAPPPTDTTPPTPPAGGTPGPPGPGNTVGSLLQPYPGIGKAPPPVQPGAGDFPTYTPPPAFSYADFQMPAAFKAPTYDEAQQEPGFQFRLGTGRQALENSAAARGTLRTGGTLKDILDYGQNFASNEYRNVYDRSLGTYRTNFDTALQGYATNRGNALDTYNTNYQTQYTDPYDFKYAGALNKQTQGNTAWNQAYQNYLQDYNMWRNRNLDTENALYRQQQLGLQAT